MTALALTGWLGAAARRLGRRLAGRLAAACRPACSCSSCSPPRWSGSCGPACLPRRPAPGPLRRGQRPQADRQGAGPVAAHLRGGRRQPVRQRPARPGRRLLELRRRRGRPAHRAHRDQRPPVGLGRALRRAPTASSTPATTSSRINDIRVPVGTPDPAAAGGHRRPAQLFPAQLPDQAGRGAGHDQPPLVPGQGDRDLRHRLRPALRGQPLQDAGTADGAEPPRPTPPGPPRPRRCRAESFDPNDKGAQWGWPWKRDRHADTPRTRPRRPRRPRRHRDHEGPPQP